MGGLVVVLALMAFAAVAFAGVCVWSHEAWRANCLVAERERDLLRNERDRLHEHLLAYERISEMTAATRYAIQRQLGR